jgi:hypothetical protein
MSSKTGETHRSSLSASVGRSDEKIPAPQLKSTSITFGNSASEALPDTAEHPLAPGTLSSPAPSVCSSSRKRGVCSSPISDTLEEQCCWSTGGLSASGSQHSSSSASRNESFASATGESENEDGKQQRSTHDIIFDQMSSLDDLKFLIHALRKEKNASSSKHFGNSWTVVPDTKWSTQRRSGFFQWLVHRLEFSIRSLGNSVNVLQISKAEGAKLLQSLEAAFESKKMMQQPQQQQQVMVTPKQQLQEQDEPNSWPGALSLAHFDALLQCDADSLAAGLQSLMVNDKNAPTSRESDASFISLSASSDPFSAIHHYHHDDNTTPHFAT